MPPRPVALITGASSGVGVHFVRELARRGCDLILTARRVERLEEVARDLRGEFDGEVTVVGSDLDRPTGARELFEAVRRLPTAPVSILINNAGIGKVGGTLDQSLEDIASTIQVNVTSLTLLARLFADSMREQGGGRILNHASFSAIQPPPLLAVYSGTKSYVLAFSQALRHDVRRHGVVVSVLCPGFFQSDFFQVAGFEPSFMVRQLLLQPEAVARVGIRGLFRGTAVIIPGPVYRMLNVAMRFLPRTAATWIAHFAMTH